MYAKKNMSQGVSLQKNEEAITNATANNRPFHPSVKTVSTEERGKEKKKKKTWRKRSDRHIARFPNSQTTQRLHFQRKAPFILPNPIPGKLSKDIAHNGGTGHETVPFTLKDPHIAASP